MTMTHPPYRFLAAATIGAAIAIATVPPNALGAAVVACMLAAAGAWALTEHGRLGVVVRRALLIGPFIAFLALLEGVRGGLDARGTALGLELPLGILFAATFVCKTVGAALLGIAWGERVGAHGIARTLQRARFPAGAVATTYVTAAFVGTLKEEWDRVRLAANARGLNRAGLHARMRQMGGSVVSVLVRSLRRGDRVALAMRARGFAGRLPNPIRARTHYGWRDALLGSVAVGVVAAAVWARSSGRLS